MFLLKTMHVYFFPFSNYNTNSEEDFWDNFCPRLFPQIAFLLHFSLYLREDPRKQDEPNVLPFFNHMSSSSYVWMDTFGRRQCAKLSIPNLEPSLVFSTSHPSSFLQGTPIKNDSLLSFYLLMQVDFFVAPVSQSAS